MEYRIKYKNCPLCDSNVFFESLLGNCSKHPLYKNDLSPDMQWMECKKCEHIFIDGYFNQQGIDLIFSDIDQEKQ